MPQFNDPTVELTSLEKDDVLMSGSPTDFANIKAQNVFNTNLTRAALQTLISASGLIIGHKYTITNAVTSTLVLVCEAVAVNKLDEIAVNASNGDNVSYDITTDIATAIQQTQINGTGFVKASGTTLSYDNSTYLTSIEGIAAGGELEGNYASPTLKNSSVVGKVLTGLSVTGSAVVSTDSVLAAIGKLQNQVNGLAGGVEYQGTWNASTNTPTLTSSVGTQGFYYVVSVAGSTNLNGITTWELGDWAIFNGTTWQKVDNTDAVVSVNGYTGIVTLSATDVSAVPTSAISGTSGTIPLFGASNTLGDSNIVQSGTQLITNNAANTGEHFIIGGSARVNGSVAVIGAASFSQGISVDVGLAIASIQVKNASTDAPFIGFYRGGTLRNTLQLLTDGSFKLTDASLVANAGLTMGALNGTSATFSGTLQSGSHTLTSGSTLSMVQGDIYIQSGGYGILSPNASRLLVINNGALGVNGALSVVGGQLNVGNGTITGGVTYSTRTEVGSYTNHDLGLITNSTTKILITASGNVLIGTTTDNGVDKLQVSGSGYFSSSVAIGNTVTASVATPSTHKVTMVIGGVTYYLLATNV